jgi:PKD repeat protein
MRIIKGDVALFARFLGTMLFGLSMSFLARAQLPNNRVLFDIAWGAQTARTTVGENILIFWGDSKPNPCDVGNPDEHVYFFFTGQTPPGMSFDPSGYFLIGTPMVPGTYYFSAEFGCSGFSDKAQFQLIVSEVAIDSVELTQGIQEIKTLDALVSWLNGGAWPNAAPPVPYQLGDMPVPLVANKPALLRVYFKEVKTPTRVGAVINALPLATPTIDHLAEDSREMTLLPGCTPAEQRLHLQSSGNSCHSLDFLAGASLAKAGSYKLWIGAEDLSNIASYYTAFIYNYAPHPEPLSHDQGSYFLGGRCSSPEDDEGIIYDTNGKGLPGRYIQGPQFQVTGVSACQFPPFVVNQAADIVLHPVSVCHRKPGVNYFTCGDPEQLPQMARFFQRVVPSGSVTFSSNFDFVLVQQSAAADGPSEWWDRVSDLLEDSAALLPRATPTERHIAFGVVHPDAPYPYRLGESNLLSDSGSSRSSAVWTLPNGQAVDNTVETMAHEVGHALGLDHTGTDVPRLDSIPGCYNLAKLTPVPDTLKKSISYWPYTSNGNWIVSGDPLNPVAQVGVDIARNRVVGSDDKSDPNQAFELMGYCYPNWVSPWSVTAMYKQLKNPTDTITIPVQAAAATGSFMLISGELSQSGLTFDPVFTIDTTASTDPGTGSYRIEVRGAGGGVLYARSFTPTVPVVENSTDTTPPPLWFSQLVPVQPGAASIAVIDDTGVQRGTSTLGGVPPTVAFTFPSGGELLQGTQNVAWSVAGAGNATYSYWLQYSADNGASWKTLGLSVQDTTLPINFDLLAGASGTGLLRIYASDGIATGRAVSAPFSVPGKLPQAKIEHPSNGDIFYVGQFLSLEGSGFTLESGILSGASLTWSSSGLGGTLGTGDEVNLGILGESAVGNQTIKLTATDTAGNQATDSVTIVVQEQPPVIYPDLPPVANAGASYVGTEGSPVVFSGGGSYASDFTALTYAWNFGDGGTSTDQSPSHVFVDNGSYQVTLTVTDQKGRTDTATATATIANVPPTVVAGAAVTGKNTRPINLTASFSDPGLHDAPWKVTWSFGDGSTSPITSVSAQGAVAVSHTYQAAGQFTATVTVTDKDGGSGSATIPVTITSIGDLNNDGKVDCADMAIVKASFGKKTGQVGFDARADVNGDGIVNVLDLSTVARQLPLGTTCP